MRTGKPNFNRRARVKQGMREVIATRAEAKFKQDGSFFVYGLSRMLGRDHVASAELGFSYLQHLNFEPTDAGLVVGTFKTAPQIFDKAYGNYLGLVRLGEFMTHQLDISVASLNIMVGVAKLERIARNDSDRASLVGAAKALKSGPIELLVGPVVPAMTVEAVS